MAQRQKKWAPKVGALKGVRGAKGGPEGWGAQNFALFSPLPPQFSFFFFFLWVFSRAILVVFEAPGPTTLKIDSGAPASSCVPTQKLPRGQLSQIE